MLTLAIGDLFIPDRVAEIPPNFCKLLAPNAPSVPANSKIAQVLCLGNITQSVDTLQFLYDLSPAFHAVRGEFDDASLLAQQLALKSPKTDASLPFYKIVAADNFRIGFTSGYQIVPRNDPLLLLAFAREIDVDILVWGGTHRVEAYTLGGKFFINPGTLTGAFNLHWPEVDEEEYEGTAEPEKEESGAGAEAEAGDADKEPQEKPDEPKALFDASHLSSSVPSFCLLDTSASRCTLYIYTFLNGEVKVDKVMYSKD